MALISMAVYDTEENQRAELTSRTIESLLETVDLNHHRIVIVDNGSCDETQDILRNYSKYYCRHLLSENIGTSRAINIAWQHRRQNEHAIKIDNDVIIHSKGWVDEMEEAIAMDRQIGIIGLKRKDIIQNTQHPDPNYRSELVQLPHEAGQRWVIVERTPDIIGTCTMFNSALLDKVGYSYQPGLYGYEDVLFSHRSHLAGFYNCFLPHIEIDHIDPGNTPYQTWKEKASGEDTSAMIETFKAYVNGTREIYEPFY